MANPVLVLGARNDVKLPDLHFKNIYTANGAAELVKNYRKKYQDINHTSIFGEQEFKKNLIVQKKIIDSDPNRIVIRNRKINLLDFNFQKLEKMEIINSFEDIKLQMEFLNLTFINFVFAELKYSENRKFHYFLKCLKKCSFQGFSSGLFAMLLALKENSSSEVIVSGIGLDEGGGHFYTSLDNKGFFSENDKKIFKKNIFRNTNRKRVERYLFKNLKKNFKARIKSPNEEFCNSGVVKYVDFKNFL